MGPELSPAAETDTSGLLSRQEMPLATCECAGASIGKHFTFRYGVPTPIDNGSERHLARRTLREDAYIALKNGIVHGMFAAGEQLDEAHWV